MNRIQRLRSLLLLAGSISIIHNSYALSPINSVQDGRIIRGGNFYNTANGKTTFVNNGAGGLWLKSGTTVKGLEVEPNGTLNDNGGTIHLYAPGNVIRLDGTIDVSSFNGGKVFIDSAYLFQNGNIFANGIFNGGLVQANVGAMTMGSGAQIQAKGGFGTGGVISIHSSGPVDIRRNAVIDSSGAVSSNFDTNVINIEGSLIRHEGVLRANGVTGAMNSKGGTIRLIASGQSDFQEIKDSLQAATQKPANEALSPTISIPERTSLLQRLSGLIRNQEGGIEIARSLTPGTGYVGEVSASGLLGRNDLGNDYTSDASARAGDGGTIILTAAGDIRNQGNIRANGAKGDTTNDSGSFNSISSTAGGNGGAVTLVAQGCVINSQGQIEANGGMGVSVPNTELNRFRGGDGGDGGLIALGYNGSMLNQGGIIAHGGTGGDGPTTGAPLGNNRGLGGNGGLVVFSGNANPTGGGDIDVNGAIGGNTNPMLGGSAGTIVSPNPGTLGQTQIYLQQGYRNGTLVQTPATQQTQTNELLSHRENLILLTRNGGDTTPAENLFERLTQARIRSVEDPAGNTGRATSEVINKNTDTSSFVFRNLIIGSSRDRLGLDLTAPYIKPPFGSPPEFIEPAPLSRSLAFTTLNTLNIVNDGSVQTLNTPPGNSDDATPQFDYWVMAHNHPNLGGGHIALLANGTVTNLNTFGSIGDGSGGGVNIAATGDFQNGDLLEGHLTTNGEIHGGSIIVKSGRDITPDSENIFGSSNMKAQGGLMGGNIYLSAKRNYTGTNRLAPETSANGSLQGGNITITAGNNLFVQLPAVLQANGTSSLRGRGGFIKLHANNLLLNQGTIEANGGQYGGTISLTAGDRIPGNEKLLLNELENLPMEAFSVLQLTPPITLVNRIANTQLGETVYNRGIINTLGGSGGKNGNIYLGANQQVVFGANVGQGGPDLQGGILNGAPVRYYDIVHSSSPSTAFQSTLRAVQNNGGNVYIVAGQTLTNAAGRTRTAVEVVNAEAAPNHAAPNVNPNQNGQGARLSNDFFLPNP